MNGIKIQYLNGLGLVAKSKRQIKSGRQYDVYFPKPEKNDPIVNNDGSVTDTVDYCKKIVSKTLNDTKRVVPFLKGSTLDATCNNVFKFIYDHIQYEEDKPGVEQVRRPSRAWSDRRGDCDCMSIFASSCLTNLGIPHSFRIVKMYGRNWFQHIYVIVPRTGKTDMTKRENYIVIDPVLDKFNQEAPKINHKKDFKMENLSGLSGIPIQYLNGVDESLKFGEEFNGLEGFNGTEEQLYGEWNRRMKTHLVNTHNYIARNPRRVSAFYQPEKLTRAYKELIGVWDSEHAREGTLDRLSASEESFLQPHLQGLGDILHGDDDRLFGLINADLNGLGSLGKSKKAAARKAARASKKANKKRGHFTKVKQATKKIKELKKKVDTKVKVAAKKAGEKAKKVAKKIGKLVIKSATWPILAGGLLAMKTNFGKMASRMYWGLFPKDEAMQHGILPDYWEASKKNFDFIKKIFVDKLQGKEETLRKAIITGRGAKVAKRGTHGLGDASELYTNGLSGLGVVGYDDAAALATAFAAILAPTLAFVNKNMKGKKATADGEVDDGNATGDDTGGDDSLTEDQSAHIEDNYNNEVVEQQPEQEPEADGSVAPEENTESVEGIGEREIDSQLGDLGKKIKSKKGTKVHKRIKKDKISRAAKRKARKSKRKARKSDIAQKHIDDANALKKVPKHKLIAKIREKIAKLKANHKLKKATPAQIEEMADNIQNKSPEQIISEAKTLVDKVTSGEGNLPTTTEPTVTTEQNTTEQDGGRPSKQGMSTTAKLGLVALAGLALMAISKATKKKSNPAFNGLSGPKKHSKKELIAEGHKIQKLLAKKGEKLPHGYDIANRKKKVIRIK